MPFFSRRTTFAALAALLTAGAAKATPVSPDAALIRYCDEFMTAQNAYNYEGSNGHCEDDPSGMPWWPRRTGSRALRRRPWLV